jgi:hypothetical protein
MKFDFSKNQTVSNIDIVPQDFRGLYVEGDNGEFKLDSDNAGVKSAVAAVVRLNEALNASRQEARTLKSSQVDLSPLTDFGDTPEAIAATVKDKLKAFEDELAKGKDAKLNLDKIKEDLAKTYAKESEGKDARINALTGQLYDLMVKNDATRAIAEEKGDVELLMPFVTQQVKPVEEDGQFKVFVVDNEKERRYSGTTGQPMTIKELVQEMKGQERYGKLFESTTPSGPGMKPGARRGAGPQQREEMTANQKIAAGLQKGQYAGGRR